MLNHITIMGRLVAEPELRITGNGTKVASFRIACDRGRDKNGESLGTDFIDAVAWRSKGEFICRNFHKGGLILLTGRLQIRPWETKDGQKRYATEIVVEEVNFCGDKRKSSADESVAVQDAVFKELDGDDDDLPWKDDDLPFAVGEGEQLPL